MAAGVSETGTQLFVRLGCKPSLQSLDPSLFPGPHSLRPGDAVEFYGPSGCGKSEMLLHLLGNCILPRAWRGAELGGLGVGVVLVDADYQFSMLRLFHVLERRVHARMEERESRGEIAKGDTATKMASKSTGSGAEQCVQPGMERCATCHQLNPRIGEGSTASQVLPEKACQCQRVHSEREGSVRKKARTSECLNRLDEVQICAKDECAEESESNFKVPTSEETEAFVKTCLDRFYLVRAGGSSEQLVVTLHSLESLIANRPDLGVLMLENVAAFYWTDRADGGAASSQEANQRRAVGIIKRLIGEYQLVLLATKPALVQRGRRNTFWGDDKTPTARFQADAAYEHHEFMSSAWNRLMTQRFVLRRHERVVHGEKHVSTQSSYTALRTLPSSDAPHRFSITEQGVVHQ